ncbi:MAG: S49 family peptidase [Planctomycetia bacterium]|nr:S49 family peptidase [Planctomycetia bacterium]
MHQLNLSAEPIADLTGVQFARLDEYCGLWSIEPTRGLALFDRCANTDLLAHVLAAGTRRVQSKMKTLAVAGPNAQSPLQIAVITIAGTLMKQESSLDSSSSTIQLKRDISQAANDATIGGIMLVIDSPGGSVAGTADLAAAVSAANLKKPVHAFGEDLVASAAYWVASQTERFTANDNTALIGSIGTFIGTYDASAAAAMKGMKAKVYATGPLKGAGFPGAAITPEQDAYLQSIVDQTQQHFADAVSAGRKMSPDQVKQVATGGVFVAQNALKLGLIDGIESFDAAMSALTSAIQQRANSTTGGRVATGKETPMSVNTAPASAASSTTSTSDAAAATAGAPTTTTAAAAAPATAVAATPTTPAAEANAVEPPGKRFITAFGPQGGVWYAEGLSFEEAKDRRIAALTSEVTDLKTQVATLTQVNKTLRGEAAPVTGGSDAKDAGQKTGDDAARFSGKLSTGMSAYAAGLGLKSLTAAKK